MKKHKRHPERIAKRIAAALGLASTGRLIHHAAEPWPRYVVSAHGPHHVIVRCLYPAGHAPARPLKLTFPRSITGVLAAQRIREDIRPRYRLQLRDALNAAAAAR